MFSSDLTPFIYLYIKTKIKFNIPSKNDVKGTQCDAVAQVNDRNKFSMSLLSHLKF